MKLLIVDDDVYTREGLAENIPWELYGIEEVMQAENGKEALHTVSWYLPDLIITDIRMPQKNGIDFCKEAVRLVPDCKIIFITGYMQTKYLKDAIDLSAVAFIEKPIQPEAVLEALEKAVEKIRRQQTELLKTETRWKWMKSLSDTANGTITGKARIMLETYIQMQYFDRILARANIRLMTMSSGQYELVRRKENKSRVGKTGLELDVVDHYNGTVRSVKTLSGGETFQASLSLALGLSDEIQSSSGGIQLDTMFVDEGFGSLDEDALDQAIRALKDLSQGSRLVGIVSHVAELKERIDKKIIVTKKRTEDGVGSTICIEG